MKETGIVRKLDPVGRITIPSEFLQAAGIPKRALLEIKMQEDKSIRISRADIDSRDELMDVLTHLRLENRPLADEPIAVVRRYENEKEDARREVKSALEQSAERLNKIKQEYDV